MEKDNIKVFKLLSGEEVVAERIDIPEGNVLNGRLIYRLLRPVTFAMVPINSTQVGVEMRPFIMLSKDDEVDISEEFVVAICNPIEEIVTSYANQFSTIVVPEKRLIT